LRDIPGPPGATKTPYYSLAPDAIERVAREFKDAGIRIAFLDTPFLKFDLPGTEPLRSAKEDAAVREKRREREQALFDSRLDDLRQGIRASHVFDCPLVRIFTFTRLAEPESVFPRIAEIIDEMASIAEKDGVKLLIENETTQNAGTSAETAKLLKLLPRNVGINWDSLNAGRKALSGRLRVTSQGPGVERAREGQEPARLSGASRLECHSQRPGA